MQHFCLFTVKTREILQAVEIVDCKIDFQTAIRDLVNLVLHGVMHMSRSEVNSIEHKSIVSRFILS